MELGQPHFMPHGICYLWNAKLLLLHVASDAAIALAYFSIPVMLIYFIRRRRDVPFGRAFVMFGTFIVACGITHVMGIWTVWWPAFWLDGILKAGTAVASLATAVMLVPLLPKALAFKSPAELERLNSALSHAFETRANALAESERLYNTLADALPQIVWTAAASGEIEYYNEAYFAYTGLTLEEARGWGWEPVVHADDLALCIETWKDSLSRGVPFEFECRLLRKSDASYRWHVSRAVPVRDGGQNVVRWFGTCTDIDDLKRASEAAGRYAEQVRLNARLAEDLQARQRAEEALRASEERFRQVEEHAPNGLALMTLDGRFTSVNPALCKFLGYTEDEFYATTFQALTHPDDVHVYLEQLPRLLAGDIDSYGVQKRYLHKDGHVVWGSMRRCLVRTAAGEPSYLITQIEDVTERKATEEALEIARQAALAASETKSRFLAMMSHEIRTPMNGVIGMSELLLLTPLNDEQCEYARIVRDSGRSLLRVLNDILDYSKMEAGKLDLEAVDFELASQVRSVVSLLGPQFSAKRVALTTKIDPRLPAVVKGDPGRIRQILINLVGNALKFTPSGGAVSIAVDVDSACGGEVPLRFTVADSGIGIPPEVSHRLFKPFSQADDSTTRRFGGTGLGLSICKQLVEIMSGEIGVESAPGSGASFWFAIPFEAVRAASRPICSPATERPERRATVRSRPEKLLLAEDNEINALLALRQFKRLGFAVTVVSDGEQAVEAIQRERFDLAFMDAQMPKLDGFAATERIRALERGTHRRLPIVAMTADAQPEDRARCLDAGMDDYLAKPVTLEELEATTERWLAPRERERNSHASAFEEGRSA